MPSSSPVLYLPTPNSQTVKNPKVSNSVPVILKCFTLQLSQTRHISTEYVLTAGGWNTISNRPVWSGPISNTDGRTSNGGMGTFPFLTTDCKTKYSNIITLHWLKRRGWKEDRYRHIHIYTLYVVLFFCYCWFLEFFTISTFTIFCYIIVVNIIFHNTGNHKQYQLTSGSNSQLSDLKQFAATSHLSVLAQDSNTQPCALKSVAFLCWKFQ